MSLIVTFPAVFAFLEQARLVFSACETSNAAVSITENSIAADAYNGCTTITSLVIGSTVTAIGKYTIIYMIIIIIIIIITR
jgi:hypothetical protein